MVSPIDHRHDDAPAGMHSWFQRIVISSFQNPVDVYAVLHSTWKQQVWLSLLK
jgi:hypothetical protein